MESWYLAKLQIRSLQLPEPLYFKKHHLPFSLCSLILNQSTNQHCCSECEQHWVFNHRLH